MALYVFKCFMWIWELFFTYTLLAADKQKTYKVFAQHDKNMVRKNENV